MSNIDYREPVEELAAATEDMHRAIISLVEELEAIDSYNQRALACNDAALKTIFEHNRDEEKEHASMLLKWMRKNDHKFDKELNRIPPEKPIGASKAESSYIMP